MEPQETYERAISAFGRKNQLLKFAEEMGECLAAMARFEAGIGTKPEVLEELADVLITAEQARLILGPKLVDAAREKKLARLRAQLPPMGNTGTDG